MDERPPDTPRYTGEKRNRQMAMCYAEWLIVLLCLSALAAIALAALAGDVINKDLVGYAAREGQVFRLRAMLWIRPEFRQRAISEAAQAGAEDSLESVLSLGGRAEFSRGFLVAPLGLAVLSGDLESAKLLVEHGCSMKGDSRFVPLPLAAGMGHAHIVRWLLSEGVSVNQGIRNGFTALHAAVEQGHEDLVSMLFEAGADPDAQVFNTRETPLHLASERGYLPMARALVEAGCDVDVQDKDGTTPLHFAARYGQYELARLLVEHNADPNVAGRHSVTPLHLAAWEGDIRMIKLLLGAGGDPEIKGPDGRTPLDFAIENEQEKAARILKENVD